MNAVRLAIFGIVIAIVVLLAAAALFVVRQSVSGLGPVAPVVVSAPELTPGSESQRVFRIDPNRSTARYQVFEELFGGTVGSPIGETSAIAGDILVDLDKAGGSRFGVIIVNVESLVSDSGMRDSRLRKEYLESSKYPEVEMRFGQALDLPESLEQGEEYTLRIEGDLTVKGITALTVWDLTFAFDETHLRGSARTEILMSTYGVGPISIAEFLKTKDEVLLSIDLVAYDIAAGIGPEARSDSQVATATGQDVDGPSFAGEILPILSSTCATCHQVGEVGSGHWTLETAADAAKFADDLALVTRLGYMPPWKPGGATVTSWCDIPTQYDGLIVEVGGHMHTMGTHFSLTLNPGRSDEQVIFEIPQWDFNWQGRYQYSTPIQVNEGDTIRISCTWKGRWQRPAVHSVGRGDYGRDVPEFAHGSAG